MIRDLLVPYPLAQEEWEMLLRSWEESSREESLLEWITLRARAGQEGICRAMEEASGASWGDWVPAPGVEEVSAEEQLLEDHGFVRMGNPGPVPFLAGGPEFPPRLEKFLGSAARSFKWVMIFPIRREEQPAEDSCRPRYVAAGDSSNAGRILAEILNEAPLHGYSDLHFEKFSGQLQVRARRKGSMVSLGEWRDPAGLELMQVLKRWAGFSSSASPLPQDGRIDAGNYGGRVHFRASHVTAVNGESLVLRMTGAPSMMKDMGRLGLPPDLQERLCDCLLNDSGLVVVSGSTCSGKTTTACALLARATEHDRKILTIEDPVEWELDGVTQSSVNAGNGWTFGRAVAAYLRQDPDIVMIGEIRDRESAEMACRAAMTGHGVVATLHAKSINDAMERFSGWGIPPGTVEDSLAFVVHQQLQMDGQSGQATCRFTWLDPQAPGPSWKARQP